MSPAARRLLFLGVAVLLLGIALWFWAASEPPSPSDAEVRTEARPAPRSRLPTAPAGAAASDDAIDPEVLAEGIRGRLGLDMRNRLCRLCKADVLESEDCRRCRFSDAGRVHLDVVGADGRPFRDHEVMVRADCTRSGPVDTYFDLPAGPCRLWAARVEGPFDVVGPAVTVEIAEGEEQYQLLEIPSEPWGGVGVTVSFEDGAIVVDGLIPGGASGDRIPEGAEILAVDGSSTEGLRPHQVGDRLAGPAGSEVTVRVGYEGEHGWEEVELDIVREPIRAADVSITAGSPG